jgi:hypothetical protein
MKFTEFSGGGMNKVKPLRVSLLDGLARHPGMWQLYQRNYVMDLCMRANVQVRYADPIDAGFAWAWEHGWRGADQAWERLANGQAGGCSEEATHVGRYLFHPRARHAPLRMAIDQNDARGIRDREAYD